MPDRDVTFVKHQAVEAAVHRDLRRRTNVIEQLHGFSVDRKVLVLSHKKNSRGNPPATTTTNTNRYPTQTSHYKSHSHNNRYNSLSRHSSHRYYTLPGGR
jgi:hypothetical protein